MKFYNCHHTKPWNSSMHIPIPGKFETKVGKYEEWFWIILESSKLLFDLNCTVVDKIGNRHVLKKERKLIGSVKSHIKFMMYKVSIERVRRVYYHHFYEGISV